MTDPNLVQLTATVAAAYLSHNTVDPSRVGEVVASIYAGLSGATDPKPEFVPAIDPAKSIKPDHLISLIDGKRYKMLKRHLANHGLTPDEYRKRYGLASDYPMVARNYANRRRELAKAIGLGRHPGAARGRRRKAA